jgi:hypothetical protein
MRLPLDTAPVLIVIESDATTFPTKFVPVSSVAEVPTAQKTLHDWAPLINNTLAPDAAVIRVEPIWNMNWALGFPWAFNVSTPVSPADEL